MSDPTQGGTPPASNQEADPIKNLKAEMDRKLADMKRQSEALAAQIAAAQKPTTNTAPKKQATEELSDDLLYTDASLYAKKLKESVKQEVFSELQAAGTAQTKINATLQSLNQEFPELMDSNHELTKKAVEIYDGLDADDKKSPTAYRLAVKEAAMELGVKPKSKRPVDEEPVGSGGYSSNSSRRRQSNKLDPATEEFAKMMGMNTDDPKVKEKLIKRSQRDWTRYKPVKE